jgi:hypothetical protein
MLISRPIEKGAQMQGGIRWVPISSVGGIADVSGADRDCAVRYQRGLRIHGDTQGQCAITGISAALDTVEYKGLRAIAGRPDTLGIE